MKRVYKKDYRHRDTRTLAYGFGAFLTRNLKKLLLGLASLTLALFLISCLFALADTHLWPAVAQTTHEVKTPDGTPPAPPGVYASAAVLTDAESGRVLFEKNAHQKLPIGSTTKMMTALVVRDQLELADQVVVTPTAADVGEQEIWLEPGETLTVEELLWALMVQSANDAAYSLAEYTTGGIESFARLMNKKAEQIGALESHFTNPHGLDEPGHHSTAYDLAVIGGELLDDPVLAEMVGCKQYDLEWPGHPYPRTCQSHNEILGTYPGATGIKTGYTALAGRCLVASATRESKSLIAVALNSEHRDSDVISLLDYGFTATARVVLAEKGQALGRARYSAYPRRYVTAVPEKELAALSIVGSGDTFEVDVSVAREAGSSVQGGDVLGEIKCRVNGHPLCDEDAVAATGARSPGMLAGIVAFLWYSLCWMGRILAAPVLVW